MFNLFLPYISPFLCNLLDWQFFMFGWIYQLLPHANSLYSHSNWETQDRRVVLWFILLKSWHVNSLLLLNTERLRQTKTCDTCYTFGILLKYVLFPEPCNMEIIVVYISFNWPLRMYIKCDIISNASNTFIYSNCSFRSWIQGLYKYSIKGFSESVGS